MKNVVLALSVLLCTFASAVAALAAPAPYEIPPGWQQTQGPEGALMFVPSDLKGDEMTFISLFPVVELQTDNVKDLFDQLVRASVQDATVVRSTDLQVEKADAYTIYSRSLEVEESTGLHTYRLYALQVHGGKGQLGVFAANSEALWQRYGPAAQRFGDKWDFAQLGRASAPTATSRPATGSGVDYGFLKKVMLEIHQCLLLQEETKFGEALKRYEALRPELDKQPRYPNAQPRTDEAFWEGQMVGCQRQVRINTLTCLLSVGRFEDAAKAAQAEIQRPDADWKVRASSYASLGSAWFYLLEYDKAREALLQARQLLEQRFSDTASRVEAVMAQMKMGKVSIGEAKEVQEAFDVLSESRTTYSKIFSLLIQLGLFEDAINLYSSEPFMRLTRILDQPEFRAGLAASMEALGPELQAEVMKRYDLLLPLERFDRVSCLLTAWRLKAADLEREEDMRRTEALLQELQKLAAAHPTDAFQQAAVHANVGAVLLGQKKWREALKELQASLDAGKAISQPLYRDSMRQLVLLRSAEAWVELGDGKAARAAIDEAQRLPVPVDNTFQSTFFWTRARVETLNGENAKAIEDFHRCLDMLERERAGVRSPDLLKTFYRRRQRMYEDAVHFLQQQKDPLAALDIMEKVRARTLRDMLENTPIAKGATTALLARLNSIREEERKKLIEENRLAAATGGAVLRGAMTLPSLTSLRTVDDVLAVRPELAQLKAGTSPTNVARHVKIDADTVVVSYFFGDQHSAAVVLDGDGKGRIYEIPVAAARLREMVGDLRASVQSTSGDEYVLDADRLHKALLAPLERDLVGKRRLVIVPYGLGNYVPWSVLGPKGGKLLVEEHDIVVLPSLSVLEFCQARNSHRYKNGLAFAIGSLSRGGMPPLPGTREEVKAISEVMPTLQVAAENDFTFDNILKRGGSTDVLHFATHGFVDAAQPERSGIMTADGRLFLSEIFRLDLHANLVVLSACETGLGKVYTGDEMVGLTRAFMYAGTPSVVATLWKVSDKGTARFMTLFYQSLAQGRDKAAALREAQLALRKEFPQPLYWAPFTLYGDWK